MRKAADMESSPIKSMYLNENGEQELEEVKGEGSFGVQTRNSRTPVKRSSFGSSTAKSQANHLTDVKITHLRKNGAIPQSPE